MAQETFPIESFVLANTQPVANGYVIISLSKDCISPNGQMSAGVKIKVLLDALGEPTGAPTFWPNSQLTPSDVFYIYSVYTVDGQRILGPIPITIGLAVEGFGVSFGTSFAS